MWNIKGNGRLLVLGTWEDNAGDPCLCQYRFSPKCSPWLAAFSEKALSLVYNARSFVRVFVTEAFYAAYTLVSYTLTFANARLHAGEKTKDSTRSTGRVRRTTCRDFKRIWSPWEVALYSFKSGKYLNRLRTRRIFKAIFIA